MSVIAACLLLLWASPAAAHGGAEPDVVRAWTADPVILVPLYVLALLYLIGAMPALASCRVWPGYAAAPTRLLLGRMDGSRAGAFVAASFPFRAIAVRSHDRA